MRTVLGNTSFASRRGSKLALLASCAVCGAGVALSANAQQASPAAAMVPGSVVVADASATLSEVVVTARRREENLERVPAAITALNSADLVNRVVNSDSDLQRTVPGLLVRATLSQNQLNFSIRGQSVDAFAGSSPGVLAYFNEVQTDALSASAYFDLSSIQVLKGPQGTLFGRNTTGGAVLFTTNKPTNHYSADILARFGNYNDREVQASANIPIVPDKVLLRLAGNIVSRDGYVRNIFPGNPNSRLGDTSTYSGRVSLLLQPTDQLQNLTVYQYTSTGGTTLGGAVSSVTPCTTGAQAACLYNPAAPFWPDFLAAHPGAFPGGLAAFLKVQQQRGPFVEDINSPANNAGHNPVLTNTTTYTISPDLLIKNIAGYSLGVASISSDVDGTPFPIFTYGSETKPDNEVTHQLDYSDELQIQGKAFDHRLTYIVGGYYSYTKAAFYDPQGFFFLTPDIPPFPMANNDNQTVDRSEAGFFQGTYDLSSWVQGLHFTGGFRYTFEQIRTSQLARSQFFPAADLTLSNSNPSWVVGFDYQATPDLLLYVTQRGSWRSGGFNPNKKPVPGLLATGGSEFLPETTKDVEVGAKFQGRVAGRPFRLNVDAFNQWIDGIQRVFFFPTDTGPTAFTNNVPKAEISGAEVDTELRATPWLTLGGNVSYQDARFTSNKVVAFGTTVLFGPYADAPRWSGTAFAELSLPMARDAGEITLRGEVYGQSKFFFSSLNNTVTPDTEIAGYTVANFRLNWSNIGGSRYGAALFVNNAFDRTYYLGGLAVGAVLGINTAVPASPRFFGVELRASF